MLLHAVVAMLRKDHGERVVSLHRVEGNARRAARRFAAAHSGRFIRFRVRPMVLSASEVEAIVFEWGRDDAAEGHPLLADRLPQQYRAAYRRGHQAGKQTTRPSGTA
jgi:hypothetical protein